MRQTGGDRSVCRALRLRPGACVTGDPRVKRFCGRRRDGPGLRHQTDERRGTDRAHALVDRQIDHACFPSRRRPYRPRRIRLSLRLSDKERIKSPLKPGQPDWVTRPWATDRSAPDGVRSRPTAGAKRYSQRTCCRADPAQLPKARGLNLPFQEIRHAYLPFWLGPFCVAFKVPHLRARHVPAQRKSPVSRTFNISRFGGERSGIEKGTIKYLELFRARALTLPCAQLFRPWATGRVALRPKGAYGPCGTGGIARCRKGRATASAKRVDRRWRGRNRKPFKPRPMASGSRLGQDAEPISFRY